MPRFVVPADVHTDDWTYDVRFDCTRWLKKASVKDLTALANGGWSRDYPADEVAIYMARYNRAIAELFKYIETVNRGREHIGFECLVDETAALRWLEEYRPSVLKKVLAGSVYKPPFIRIDTGDPEGE
jgi:hypothetical protein